MPHSMRMISVLALSRPTAYPGWAATGQHPDSAARHGGHMTTNHQASPHQVVRRPTPGHRGGGDKVHCFAISTAADARMPMARTGIHRVLAGTAAATR